MGMCVTAQGGLTLQIRLPIPTHTQNLHPILPHHLQQHLTGSRRSTAGSPARAAPCAPPGTSRGPPQTGTGCAQTHPRSPACASVGESGGTGTEGLVVLLARPGMAVQAPTAIHPPSDSNVPVLHNCSAAPLQGVRRRLCIVQQLRQAARGGAGRAGAGAVGPALQRSSADRGRMAHWVTGQGGAYGRLLNPIDSPLHPPRCRRSKGHCTCSSHRATMGSHKQG